MNGTIPEDIDAMVSLLVANELIRLAPVKCAICRPGDQCWFCRPFVSQTARRENGESQA